ncbi:MAG TPA: carbonic anhydrase [Desulfosporosinus sp.]
MRKGISYIGAALLSLTLILSGCGAQTAPKTGAQTSDAVNPAAQQVIANVYKRTEVISSPDVAMQLLIEGNNRFITGKPLSKDFSATRRMDLMKNGQHPFAVIVSCSDSRVPPELLLDQALGDLFVIRVAGNVITPVEMGSVEYAVEHLKSPLVLVLGHEGCGAVTATVQGGETPGSIAAITDKIKPAVVEAKALGLTGNDLIEKSIDINIKNALSDISKSPVIKEGVEAKKIKVMGAKYDLDEGALKFINE